ncbi:MAG: class II glutamine amidotransferase [Arthrobacter sp.]|jgi:predicted glutamine amidotransferase|nr:class II glutamine amidotransferase [Arthrobacter sp.]
MCRLFGHLSNSSASLTSALGDDTETFTQLSARHKDGWGLVGLDGAGLRRIGDVSAARESALFAGAREGFVSESLLLHFRLASPGTQVLPENLHPFESSVDGVGEVAFAHNGHIFDVPALRELVARYTNAPRRGTTDSESYAHLVFALMRDLPAEDALHTAASLIQEVSDVVALNAILLTPGRLHALQWLEPQPRQDGFAYPINPELFRMRLRRDASGVSVASNEWAPSEETWEDVPEREVLSFSRAA